MLAYPQWQHVIDSRAIAGSMTLGRDSAEPPKPLSPPPAKRRLMFVVLAGILAIVGTLAGAYYFSMRPVTLRIAVGPANSDDVKVVQALTQAFSQNHQYALTLQDPFPEGWEPFFINCNDSSVEGIKSTEESGKRVWGVQFHPESAGGPLDTIEV